MTLSPSPARLTAANAALVEQMQADLAAFWSTLDLTNPAAARDALLEFVPLLVDRYGEMGAIVAAEWYDDVRLAAQVGGSFTARPAGLVPSEVVAERVRFGAQHLWTDSPDQTLAFLRAAMSKYALQPGRDTIRESAMRDPEASGWRRVARPGACDFCRMLAGRGGVYRRETAIFAAHGDCNCGIAPDWRTDAPEVDVDAYVASERMDKLRARASATPTDAKGWQDKARAQRRLNEHRARVRAWIESAD